MSIDNNAVRIGEPNCMKSFVDCIRSVEEAGTLSKVVIYSLTFFATVILSLTIVGLYFVIKASSEYSRQTTEQETRRLIAASDARVRVAEQNQSDAFDRVRERDARIETVKRLSTQEFQRWKTQGTLPPA